MTDIRTEIELRHPVRRVWRALTDHQLLAQWLGTTDLRPEQGAQFHLRPVDLPGLDDEIDGEVVELEEPHRLVLRWREQDVPTLVSYELTTNEQGCRLALRQTVPDERWTTERRRQRQQGYEQLLTGPLPAVLDWLAFREVDFTAASTATHAGAAEAATDAAAIGEPRRHRRGLVAGLITAAILAGTAMVVLAVSRAPGEQADTVAASPTSSGSDPAGASPAVLPPAAGGVPARAGAPQATASPSGSPASPSGQPTATAASPGPPNRTGAAVPGQASLAARYSQLATGLLGYTGEIVLANSGTVVAAQWTVTVVLHGGASISDVTGASHQQEGRTVTFTGEPVPAGGSARFTFRVNAALSERQPESCVAGDRPCAGL